MIERLISPRIADLPDQDRRHIEEDPKAPKAYDVDGNPMGTVGSLIYTRDNAEVLFSYKPIKDGNGKIKEYKHHIESPSGVVVIPIRRSPQGQYEALMITQERDYSAVMYNKKDPRDATLTFVQGHLRHRLSENLGIVIPAESIQQCAIRELQEEAGLDATIPGNEILDSFTRASGYMEQSSTSAIVYFQFIELPYNASLGNQSLEPSEKITNVGWKTIEELKRIKLRTMDLRTMAGIVYLEDYIDSKEENDVQNRKAG